MVYLSCVISSKCINFSVFLIYSVLERIIVELHLSVVIGYFFLMELIVLTCDTSGANVVVFSSQLFN